MIPTRGKGDGDATCEDAEAAKLDSLVPVMDTGGNWPGAMLESR